MRKQSPLFLVVMLVLASCQTLKQSSKYGLTEGYYTGYSKGDSKVSLYVFPDEDSIKVYRSHMALQNKVDSSRSLYLSFSNTYKEGPREYYFRQTTLDVDILSILLKYRPPVQGFPNQLNTSILNGAVFLGMRKDIYHLRYNKAAFGVEKRSVNHIGSSFGIFTGIGASRIDPFVTRGALSIEYDGFVNPSGVAAIIAVDKLTFGITAGVDHLLDHNHPVWIYQGKPWIGLSVGLNLN